MSVGWGGGGGGGGGAGLGFLAFLSKKDLKAGLLDF